MAKCPKCNEEIDDNSVFCHNCGENLGGRVKAETTGGVVEQNISVRTNNSFEDKKLNAMIVFGYLTLFIQLIVVFSARFNVRVINSDRIILYPLLALMLSYFAVFNLVKHEKTFIHSYIIAGISIFLLIFGII